MQSLERVALPKRYTQQVREIHTHLEERESVWAFSLPGIVSRGPMCLPRACLYPSVQQQSAAFHCVCAVVLMG